MALLLLGIFITRPLLGVLLHCFIHFTLFLGRSLPLFNPTCMLKPKPSKSLFFFLPYFFSSILFYCRERPRALYNKISNQHRPSKRNPSLSFFLSQTLQALLGSKRNYKHNSKALSKELLMPKDPIRHRIASDSNFSATFGFFHYILWIQNRNESPPKLIRFQK